MGKQTGYQMDSGPPTDEVLPHQEPHIDLVAAPMPTLRIMPHKSPWRWPTAAVAVIFLASLARFVVASPNWQWGVVWQYLFDSRVLAGLWRTILLTLVSSALGLAIGLLIAAMRMSKGFVFRGAATIFIWVIRAIPALVLLMFVFFLGALAPHISLGIPFGPKFVTLDTNSLMTKFWAAACGLALYLGAYSGEIFRGGLLSVPPGQFEAGRSLGMTNITLMRRIAMPQAIRVIIPPLANELITMFKNTSLATVIGFAELFTTVQLIYSVNFETIPLLIVACIWYLLLTSLAMLGQSRLERRFGRGYRR